MKAVSFVTVAIVSVVLAGSPVAGAEEVDALLEEAPFAALEDAGQVDAAPQQDSAVFAELIPGDEIPEEDLGRYFGAGVLEFTISGGSLIDVNGTSFDVSQLNSIGAGAFAAASGITTITQFQGDNNNVNLTVMFDIRIGTIEIMDTIESTINVSNSVDFGGIVGGFVQ